MGKTDTPVNNLNPQAHRASHRVLIAIFYRSSTTRATETSGKSGGKRGVCGECPKAWVALFFIMLVRCATLLVVLHLAAPHAFGSSTMVRRAQRAQRGTAIRMCSESLLSTDTSSASTVRAQRLRLPLDKLKKDNTPTPMDTVAEEEEEEEAASAHAPSEAFDWLGHWYPVNVLDTMDPTRPHAIKILGMSLVAWNDGATVNGEKQVGRWRVFDDACPHRLGPLSEGRVEQDGNLLCSYHGWRRSSFTCAHIASR